MCFPQPPHSSFHSVLRPILWLCYVLGISDKGEYKPFMWQTYKQMGLVAQSCLTLCDPMDFSLPGSSVHGILQARILEGVAFLLQGIFPTQEYK